MKILYVHSGADLYGASRSLLRLAGGFVKEGHQAWAVLPERGRLGGALEAAGVRVLVEPELAVMNRKHCGTPGAVVRLAVRCLRSSLRLAATIRKVDADIVHSNTATVLSGALAARLAGRPHVWHIREIFDEFPVLWRFYRRFMGAFSTRIACISQVVAAQFDGAPGSRKTCVIYNGLREEEYAPPPEEEVRAFRARNGISPEARVAAVVGRIKFVRKGQETFVRAAARIASRTPDAVFLLVGAAFPGNEGHTRRLKKLIAELGLSDRVIFAGEVSDMRTAYAAIDLLVLSSGLPEPFGLVLIEAMSFGKPVIGTAHGGAPEVIEHGRSGYLVKPNSPGEMGDAMERILNDPALGRALGANGRARFEERFRFETLRERVRALYSSILPRPLPAGGRGGLENAARFQPESKG